MTGVQTCALPILVFRWLLEDQKTPDHCTITRFRGNRNLQEAFEDLFFQYVKKLENKGYTEHSEVFVDGTKIESKSVYIRMAKAGQQTA